MRRWVRSALLLLTCVALARTCWSLPDGRAWSPPQPLSYPGIAVFGTPTLFTDGQGLPRIVIGARWDTASTGRWNVFAWDDSGWTNVVSSSVQSGFPPEVAVTREATTTPTLCYLGDQKDPDGRNYLQLLTVLNDTVVGPDTVMRTTSQDFEYAAAISGTRRWGARSHQFSGGQLHVDVAFSTNLGPWSFMPPVGLYADHISIAPVSDQSALLVTAGEYGLEWWLSTEGVWTGSGTLDPRALIAGHPEFRVRPSGGLWLLWSSRLWVHVSEWRDGKWSLGDSLRCAHPPGETFVSAWSHTSKDTAERPILVWIDLGYGYTHRDVGCISFPTANGWSTGEEIPGSDAIFLSPTVARDRNGDAWVAWRTRLGDHYWIHTYSSATASNLAVSGTTAERMLRWELSVPSQDSRWTILRSSDMQTFTPVGTVTAADSAAMTWRDDEARAGPLAYRLRRESADRAYEWTSDIVVWDEATPTQLALASVDALPDRVKLTWSGPGAGSLDASVERHTSPIGWQRVGTASPAGPDGLAFEDSSVSPGERYGYRLTYLEDGLERFTPEAWVDVPQATFSLGGFSPNPSSGRGVIRFSLPAAGDALLEVLDVSGRRMERQKLLGLTAGDHTIELRKTLPAGLYVIRLRFGGMERVARGVMVR